MSDGTALRLARGAWLALIAWQFTWLAVVPEPLGKENLLLAALLTAPLLLPLAGIVRLERRSLIWGGYLALFAAMVGMVELWAAPPERPAAALQLALCAGFLLALALGTRKRRS